MGDRWGCFGEKVGLGAEFVNELRFAEGKEKEQLVRKSGGGRLWKGGSACFRRCPSHMGGQGTTQDAGQTLHPRRLTCVLPALYLCKQQQRTPRPGSHIWVVLGQ